MGAGTPAAGITYPSAKVLALYSEVGGSGKAGRVLLSVDPVKSFLGGPYSGPGQRRS